MMYLNFILIKIKDKNKKRNACDAIACSKIKSGGGGGLLGDWLCLKFSNLIFFKNFFDPSGSSGLN